MTVAAKSLGLRCALLGGGAVALVSLAGCGARLAGPGQNAQPTPAGTWAPPKGPVQTPIPAAQQLRGPDGVHVQDIDGVRWYWCIDMDDENAGK